MIGELAKKELQRHKEEGSYNRHFFGYQTHILGYQARTSFPSLFDCDYAYAVGREAAALIQNNLTGIIYIYNDVAESEGGTVGMDSLCGASSGLLHHGDWMESNVDMNNTPFLKFVAHRDSWTVKDETCNPGSVQFGGAGSWKLEPDAVAADRKARLSEANPAAL
ncbi:uncharacterized protein [Blastocystis hominis]|uniref:Uncharacterized protein n=1 Tax=Blastocystis hominis TaxID=12968 RepID=D8M1Y4_BLAHO|nr:uncharacterized protein [Blastocystis hominis]CBK22073.2 unnamed protein product [Blastocystis hominis]|eukprot:XP_012896121.1 uncharacterized protein [Blastocystis hominis]